MDARTQTIGRIAQAIGATVEGDAGTEIVGAGAVASAGPGQITFAVDARRARALTGCRASAAVVGLDTPVKADLTLLRVADPEAAFAAVLGLLAEPEDLPAPGVHPSAVIDPTAAVSPGAAVGPHVVIGAGATVGAGAVLCANVVLGARSAVGEGTVLFPGVVVRERCRIGRRCRIHPNTVIGADGFGYFFRDGVHHKVPHVGGVEIGDDVEIGACACVDRAKFGDTRIGDGCKIDNLVQIAHNVRLGRGVILVGQVGIAGSATLGDFVVLGGHVGVRDNVTVGDGVRALAYTAIAHDVEPDQSVSGIPAMPAREHLRLTQMYTKLPELRQQLKELQSRLDALEQKTKDHCP